LSRVKAANGLHAKRAPRLFVNNYPRIDQSSQKFYQTEEFLLNWIDLPPQIPLRPATAPQSNL